MARKVDIKRNGSLTTTSVSVTNLFTVDLATLDEGALLSSSILCELSVVMHEVGGGTYSSGYHRSAVFQVNASSQPTIKGSVLDGDGQASLLTPIGDQGGTVTLDASGTTIRVRITPSTAGDLRWFGTLRMLINEP
jgi:hypothetical protein